MFVMMILLLYNCSTNKKYQATDYSDTVSPNSFVNFPLLK